MPGERTRARGELEAAVMDVLWAQEGALTSREIMERMPGRQPAPTTLLTALDRLHRKGRVNRIGDGPRGIRFDAAASEAEHTSRVMLDTLGETQDRNAALLLFAGDLSASDVDLLRSAIASRSKKRRGPSR